MPSYDVTAPNSGCGFDIRSTNWVIGPLILSRSRVGPVSMRRSGQRIRSDNRDHYVAIFTTEGRWDAETDAGPVAVEIGSLYLMDMTRPIETRTEGSSSIMLLVPRLLLDGSVPPFDLHGLVLDNAYVRLFGDYLIALVDRLPELEATDAEPVGRGTCDFLAKVLNAVRERVVAKPTAPLLTRAKSHIATHLEDDLSVTAIATALRTSRSSLFKAFAPLGGTGPYILKLRLARAHELLARPDEHRKVSEIGFSVGFKSESHFSRAFREAYGYTPRALQQKSARHRPEAVPRGKDVHDTYPGWRGRLR